MIGFCRPLSANTHQHHLLMANCFAHAEALAFFKMAAEFHAAGLPEFRTPFRVTEGSRPTNVILGDGLDPATLGALVAVLDSFDQWDVELANQLAGRIIPELARDTVPELAHDSSTNGLIALDRARRA